MNDDDLSELRKRRASMWRLYHDACALGIWDLVRAYEHSINKLSQRIVMAQYVAKFGAPR